MANSAMLQFSNWRQLWHLSLYPNGVIFETLWSLCREELLIWPVLQCYNFLIKGSFGVHLRYPDGVVFQRWWCREELLMWRILQCYNFLIEGQVWGSSVHAQIHWFSRDDDNAEKNFRCAKFCNATVFSSKVALVIQLHSQMESFFSNAGTSKVANLHCYKFPPQRWLWWSSVSTHMEWFSGYVWWCREELPDFVKKCAPLSHAFLLSTAVI